MKLKNLYETVSQQKVDDLYDLLEPTDRVFFSDKKFTKFREPVMLGYFDKPGWRRGHPTTALWYAFGSEWLVTGIEEYGFNYNHLYELNLNMDKLYIIKNEDDLNQFNSHYGITRNELHWLINNKANLTIEDFNNMKSSRKKQYSIDEFTGVAWDKLWQDGFAGLEFPNYFKSGGWNNSWDVSSGAIWGSEAIININLIFGPNDLK